MSHLCQICQQEFEEYFYFSKHIVNFHKMKIEDYLIKYKYNGERPVCLECGAPVQYAKQVRDFNKFCKEHANLARSKWGRENGFGAKVDQNQNLGKTKENCDYMKERSERMMGVGVKVFTKEEIKENTKKRLQTERERGSRRLKESTFQFWVNRAFLRGMEVLTCFSDVARCSDIVKMRCIKCGEIYFLGLMSFCQNHKEKTVGCKKCTKEQIGEINAELFKKSFEDFNKDVAWILNNLQFRVLTPYSEYKNNQTKLEVECTKCGKISNKSLGSMIVNKNKCYFCSKQGKSQWEEDLAKELRKVANVVVDMHYKIGRKEIDLLVRNGDKIIGIELNGLYWHCEREKEPNYHLDKYNVAKDSGVPLMQFYEDEWRDKKDLIVSMILQRVGVAQKSKAKECSVVVYNKCPEEVAAFFSANHISGNARGCDFCVCLMGGNKIISAASFRKPFVKKYGDKVIEIARYATKMGHSVEFGFSRLMKYAIQEAQSREYMSILSYADLRFGDGDVYKYAGFELVGQTKPDYSYTDFEDRFHRFKFRATQLMTEREVAASNCVSRIYGVGNKIWLLKIF